MKNISRLVVIYGFVFLAVGCRQASDQTSAPAQGESSSDPPAKNASNASTPSNPSTAEGPEAADQLLKQAEQAVRAREYEDATELYVKAAEAAPENPEAVFSAGSALQQLGYMKSDEDRQVANDYYLRSADYVRRYARLQNQLGPQEKNLLQIALYNEALSYARQGKVDRALGALQEAFDEGFSGLADAQQNEDLAEVRQRPEFEQIIRTARERIMKEYRAQIRAEIESQKPFEFSFALPDLEGNTVSLADFQGQVVIVDFWGTWCPPCREEIPHLVALHEKYRGEGLRIVGINYENESGEAAQQTIAKFVEQHGVTYPCLLGDEATQNQVPNFEGFPTTLFVDSKGTVQLKVTGYHPYEYLEAAVLELLGDLEPGDQSSESAADQR